MLCSYAKGAQGPTGTRSNLVGSHFARVLFVDIDHAATASGIAALLLLLLLLPRLGFCYCSFCQLLGRRQHGTHTARWRALLHIMNQSFVFPVLAAAAAAARYTIRSNITLQP